MIAVKPIIPAATVRTRRAGRRFPSFQRSRHQRSPKIGGATTAVNLQENARPPRTAEATKARRSPLRKKNQNKSIMPVIDATIGVSNVIRGP